MADALQGGLQTVTESAQVGLQVVTDAIDMCAIRAITTDAISDLTIFVSGLDVAKVQADIFASSLAAGLSILVGMALLLAPVAAGRNWLDTAMVVLMSCGSAIGTSLVLQNTAAGSMFDGLLDTAGATGETKCGLHIALIALLALLCGLFTQRLFALTMGALGFLGAGYAGYIAAELVRPMVPAAYATMASSDAAAYAIAALAALAGGYTLAACGKPVLNMALGVLGALLVAQGSVTLLLADVLSAEAVAMMQLDVYST